jgi:hypothetical protein
LIGPDRQPQPTASPPGPDPFDLAETLADLAVAILSLRNVEELLAERGIDVSHETVRFWWNRFGPMFAAEIRKRRVAYAQLSSVTPAFG